MGTFTPQDPRPCWPLPRRYLRIPCIGAWTPTPPRPSGASTCFFPESIGLTSRFTSSARETIPAMQLSAGERFRSCSHSVMFRLPCLLGPPVAPTAVGFAHRAAGPFTPRNERVVTLHELWHRFIPEPGNWYGGTFTHWNAALSAAPESLRSDFFKIKERTVDSILVSDYYDWLPMFPF